MIEMPNDVNYFFTADNHFDDDEIIGLEKRPFKTVAEMNEAMIANWNAVVRPKDTVWHVGDFGKMQDNKASNLAAIKDRLNGSINIVMGNHDPNNMWKIKKKFGFCATSKEDLRVDYILDGRPKKQYIHLYHYAGRTWNGAYDGAWHLFGHSHGNMPPYGKSFDVGVMNHNWRPISFAEVAAKMATLSFKN